MAGSKKTVEDKDDLDGKPTTESVDTVTKQIWLAGLGAYGRTLDEIQARREKLSSEGQKLFEDLVSRGEKLQDTTETRIKDSRDNLDKQIEKLKSFTSLPIGSNLKAQLEEVNRKLDSISSEIKKKAGS